MAMLGMMALMPALIGPSADLIVVCAASTATCVYPPSPLMDRANCEPSSRLACSSFMKPVEAVAIGAAVHAAISAGEQTFPVQEFTTYEDD